MVVSAQSLQATRSIALVQRNKFARRRIPNLKRGGFRRDARRRLILFCEGRKTERVYFEAIRRLCRSALIKVEIFAEGNVPYTLANKAVSRGNRGTCAG